MKDPDNPNFIHFRLPKWLLYPMLALAGLAGIIGVAVLVLYL